MKSNCQGNANTSWIPDSGASFHVTGEPKNIKQLQHFDGPDQIFIGNGAEYLKFCFSTFVSPYDSHITLQLKKSVTCPFYN